MSVYLNFKFPNSSAEALDRVVEAYGFTRKMQLADHLGIAASSLSARYKRDVFPSDIVLQCVMETGANLEWLITGKGGKFDESKLDSLTIVRKKLIDGGLYDAGVLMVDKIMLPSQPLNYKHLFALVDENTQYIINSEFAEIYDGQWLVDIEGKTSIRTLTRVPVKKVRVSGAGMAFDCSIDDISVIGRVILTIN
ncbi:phage repressor protein [Plesiomonas shigelloides]|uniref:phage repressor protein CI n=1 Tax=Plesiomonas shigelloides TaxID=703 RepID=UPI0012626DA7|nr:phage repressor protein CI [Plesiomonas shigelloides]KAB7698867.1 phage repressor protein [Plesiomonas shigelloides]